MGLRLNAEPAEAKTDAKADAAGAAAEVKGDDKPTREIPIPEYVKKNNANVK